MKITKVNEGNIEDYKTVELKKMNDLVEIRYMARKKIGCDIEKLNKYEYLDKRTGEIKEFNSITDRSQSKESLRKTFKKLRDLINNNFSGKPNEKFITLTYAENMTDNKILLKDFEAFIKRLKRKYKDYSIEYISIVEPQERGAWHCHVLFKFIGADKFFIPNDIIAQLWGHGFTQTSSLEDCDNIGAYLSAYLGDIELNDDTFCMLKNGDTVETKLVNGEEKKFIKGGRLNLYPPGMNIYRKSKGIEFPNVELMRYSDTKKVVGNATPHYLQTITIEDDNRTLNTIIYHQYNLKRHILQDTE